jgi:hypothetical protein
MNKAEQHEYFSALGKVGGKKRWENVSEDKRKKHIKKMNKARLHKLSTRTSLDGQDVR